MRPCDHGWRWGGLGLFVGLGLLGAASSFAQAGELSLTGDLITSGAADAGDGSRMLSGTAGQVVADSEGVEAGIGLRLQAGHEVQVATWNRPPVPGGDSLERWQGERVAKVSLTTLLGNDTDADGDALEWVQAGWAQPTGSTVMVVGNFAVYVAASGDAGHGSFEYEVRDSAGNVSRGFVTVLETARGVVTTRPNAVRLEAEGADRVFTGIGVPGRSYRVQYALEATEPFVWRDFQPLADMEAATSGALGLFRYVDRGPGEALRLYRAVAAP